MTENGTNMVMPVAPTYNGMGGGFGDFGGNGWWIILLFIILGGWGGFGGYGGFGGGVGNEVQTGFNQAALTSGLGDIQTALTAGFANAESSANARQIADMQQSFALSQQFANCCCENRLATCQLNNTVQSEAATTRYANATNTRDILENANRNNQAILDKLCALELDAKNDKIADLQRELTMANLAASQGVQTAQIIANNEAQTTALERYLAPNPIPAYVVQNPNCCNNACNVNCGCGAY